MMNTDQRIVEGESGIAVNDIIDFFAAKWKILSMGALGGLIVALGGVLLLGKYEAEATLVNKHIIETPGIDYLTWKSLKRNLPILADRISETAKENENFLKALSGESWWEKNVVATFSLAKEDAKAILGMPKEMQDAEAVKIKDFVVKTTGSSKEEALKNLSVATSFLRSGGAYLALKDVISKYQMELLNSKSDIAKKIANLEIELAYLNGRMANLELLRAKFPGNATSIITQPMDFKDSSAKYLPIITQLIAVKSDINAKKEELSRLNDKKSQLAIMSLFLSQAVPVVDRGFDGLAAVAELMRIESGMRKDLQPSELNKALMLNSINNDLALIHTRFTLGLEQPAYISTSKPRYLKPAAIGLASGFFLALLFSLCSVIWLRYRQQRFRG